MSLIVIQCAPRLCHASAGVTGRIHPGGSKKGGMPAHPPGRQDQRYRPKRKEKR